MNNIEYLIIEEPSKGTFYQALNEATKDGFTVISSSHFFFGPERSFSISFYALMVKSTSNEIPMTLPKDRQIRIPDFNISVT